ncbi:hypothetical protein GRI40_11250 [Altererythrobacter aerius]|uniref:Regulatory protein RecX n=1 Tax=Tsuneonella aeria TaxID=1837929 RepID=A0A6I4TFC3_9SPHN|nr:RecX family transcriptional regulator [Tsuneonella aeria]MXO75793.1 hypothetical protein [Tsuneonella aeria]
MAHKSPNRQTERRARPDRAPRPLDQRKLEELGLSYVARFATSVAKVEAYLLRKVRERGWEGDAPPDAAGIAARYAELGYIDDEAFARARSGGLLRRGYGARRVDQALGAAGISEALRQDVRPEEGQQRRAAVTLAARRRLGPWSRATDGTAQRETREKQIAAMLRAGHGFEIARTVIGAPTTAWAEQWAAEAEEPE